MNMGNVPEVVTKAFADKEFVSSLEKIATAEEAQKAFAAKGIEMTLDEVQQLGNLLARQDEFTEDDLDSVTGGLGVITGYSIIILGVGICLLAAGVKILWGKLTGK